MFDLSALRNTQAYLSLSILLVLLPVVLIAIIPSYVFMKIVKIKKTSAFVDWVLFTLFYIIVTFIGLAIFLAQGI